MRVPTLDSNQVQPNALPGVRVAVDAPIEAFGGTQAKALAGLGEGLVDAGKVFAKAAAEADSMRVIDADNKALTAYNNHTIGVPDGKGGYSGGYTSLRGEAALKRPGGKALPEEVVDAYQKDLTAISETLGNERQKRMFADSSAKRVEQMRVRAAAHMLDQQKAYSGSTLESRKNLSVNNIGLYFNDPAKVAEESTQIRAANRALAHLHGYSDTWVEDQTLQDTSKAHLGALSAALEAGSTDYARQYIQRFGGEMAADDLLKATATLDKAHRQRTALTVANYVRGEATQGGGDFDRLERLVFGQESGGRQFRQDGSVITSPKGAVGIAQVMPSTGPEAAKLAGLPWDETRFRSDSEYNAALGRAYLKEQIRANGGDIAKGLAAYNAGPGRVADLVAKHGDDWLSHAPAETQGYVKSIMRGYRAGLGVGTAPTLAERERRAIELLGPNADPETVKETLQQVGHYHEVEQRDLSAKREAARGEAFQTLAASGGDMAALSPSLRAALGDDLPSVMEFARTLSKREPVITDVNEYVGLMDKFKRDPASFGRVDLRAYADVISQGDLMELGKLQAKARNPDAIKPVLTDLQEIEKYSNDLYPDPKDADKRPHFEKIASQALQSAQDRAKRELEPKERKVILDELILDGRIDTMFGEKRRLFEIMGTTDENRWKPGNPALYRSLIQQEPKQYTEGQIYEDGAGRRATYRNGRFVPVVSE
jgi:soluble lytic murein transglycosylase